MYLGLEKVQLRWWGCLIEQYMRGISAPCQKRASRACFHLTHCERWCNASGQGRGPPEMEETLFEGFGVIIWASM
jgi:hypothetical protein